MLYRWLADLIVVLHLAFVLFVIFGGLLVVRHRRFAFLHIPAIAWGALIEFAAWVCPLTPLENKLRLEAGGGAYRTDFISHYLLPILYPPALTREVQIALGLLVIAINAGVYAMAVRAWTARQSNR